MDFEGRFKQGALLEERVLMTEGRFHFLFKAQVVRNNCLLIF